MVLSLCLTQPLLLQALTVSQVATAAKLGLVHTGFGALWYFKSDEYLYNWQLATGSARVFPTSGLTSDVLTHLQKQRTEVIAAVQRDIRSGRASQGSTGRIPVPSNLTAFARPSGYSDFKYAIGGCQIYSYADVQIGFADKSGSIPCTIKFWNSVLTDIYAFQNDDVFGVLGLPVFKYGELAGFETSKLAKQFSVTTNSFYASSLLGSFTIKK